MKTIRALLFLAAFALVALGIYKFSYPTAPKEQYVGLFDSRVSATTADHALLIPTRVEPTTLWGHEYALQHHLLQRLPGKDAGLTDFMFVCINPGDGTMVEFGLRSDGVVVWKETKKP